MKSESHKTFLRNENALITLFYPQNVAMEQKKNLANWHEIKDSFGIDFTLLL